MTTRRGDIVTVLGSLLASACLFLVFIPRHSQPWAMPDQSSQSAYKHARHTLGSSSECTPQFHDVLAGRLTNSTLVQEAVARRQQLQKQLEEWHFKAGNHIDEGHTGVATLQQLLYTELALIPCVRVVCEIGFNAGHSASVWLSAREDIQLVSFDMGAHHYTYSALRFYSEHFPGRISVTLGDSTKTVPRVAALMKHKCDIVVVDGGHFGDIPKADIMNMQPLANPAFHIFVIDDVNCKEAWCHIPHNATENAAKEGVLEILHRMSLSFDGQSVSDVAGAGRGVSIGRYLI